MAREVKTMRLPVPLIDAPVLFPVPVEILLICPKVPTVLSHRKICLPELTLVERLVASDSKTIRFPSKLT